MLSFSEQQSQSELLRGNKSVCEQNTNHVLNYVNKFSPSCSFSNVEFSLQNQIEGADLMLYFTLTKREDLIETRIFSRISFLIMGFFRV